MSQPPAMTVATRRALVSQLLAADPDLSNRAIAGQLGVSKDTVRSDIAALRQDVTAPEAVVATPQPEPSPDQAELTLILDEPLRQALAILRTVRGEPDTPAANAKIARAAIRVVADSIDEDIRRDRT
ncbi:HTH domain-containing protein [Streptomyces sp. NPDC005227]|uniref:HTH domain-containing protein n=1 Tax=Streptomyces sp. NPDC005227 TaxID=3364707 RepID=UPI003673910E